MGLGTHERNKNIHNNDNNGKKMVIRIMIIIRILTMIRVFIIRQINSWETVGIYKTEVYVHRIWARPPQIYFRLFSNGSLA